MEKKDADYLKVQIKTDCKEVYEISRAVFFAFAAKGKALLEMTLKKGSLEDIFLQLAESGEADGKQSERAVSEK
mgnify:FL=1